MVRSPPGSSGGRRWAVLLAASGQIPLAIDAKNLPARRVTVSPVAVGHQRRAGFFDGCLEQVPHLCGFTGEAPADRAASAVGSR